MEKNEVSDLRKGCEVWICYLDDDGKQISGYFVFVRMTDSILEFRSGSNLIVIPISKLIKLKMRFG